MGSSVGGGSQGLGERQKQIPVTEFSKTYEYDEVVPWVIEAVAPLGEEYQARTRELLEGRWVDVYENEGKYSGAFQDDAYGHPHESGVGI